jgi:hypothetical protein
MSARPTIARQDDDGRARAAVEALVTTLQTGWDTSDAEIADRQFSATSHGAVRAGRLSTVSSPCLRSIND